MAWIDGRWVERNERAELIATYREYLEVIDERYPNIDDMPADLAVDYVDRAKELQRLERIHRCEQNLLEFSLEYFSEARNPGNAGNWDGFDIANASEAPNFHREIAEIMDDVSTTHKNAKVAVAAPRSHAKSTYLSKAFPVRDVVYRKRRYIIIISETPSVSKANMEWIRNQLKFNRKLREDFGPLLSPKDQANIRDNGDGFIAWHPDGELRKQIALVEAASTGQALRGRNWNGSRPDLIICDDLEDARPGGNASTPEQRQALRDWFAQTVMPLGDPKGKRTAFVYMGTTVHFDSLLMHVLYHRGDFKTRIYRAIISQPERQDLWDECRKIYIDFESENSSERALAFYREHEAEMLRGAEVLWPEVQPLWKLMTWKWDNGSKAFNTEYQNNPVDEESQIFDPEKFTYYDTIDIPPDDLAYVAAIDFAMGKERGDYSAMITLAKNRRTGVCYVVDAYIERVHPDVFLKEIVKRALKYQHAVIAVEAQMAQEFFADKLEEELQRNGYPAYTRLRKVKQKTRKQLRIEALLPDIQNGKLRFNRNHRLLIEMFELYPNHNHDDGPDALSDAYKAAKKLRRMASST